MTDFKLLKEAIQDSGLKIASMCEKAGINRANFYNKMKGKGEFTASEIYGLSKALNLSIEQRDRIFFAA